MTLQSALAAIPWWAKAAASALLILFTISECRGRDAAIARNALWQVSWDSTVATKKLTDAELKAAKDTARLLVAQSVQRDADLKLARAQAAHQKVIVLHDTVPGQPTPPPDTVAQADLPVVKACSAALDAKIAALSSCQLVNIFMAKQHADDSIALRLAFRKPTPSRTRDMTMGAGAGATIVLIVLHLLHAHL